MSYASDFEKRTVNVVIRHSVGTMFWNRRKPLACKAGRVLAAWVGFQRDVFYIQDVLPLSLSAGSL
jgi:hypothetical protein